MTSVDRYAWWRAVCDSSLSPTARHVGLTLGVYMSKAGRAWPSLSTLASDTGRSRDVCKRAVRELREAGFLAVEAGGGRSDSGTYRPNRYQATVPSRGTDAPPDEGSRGTDAPAGTDLAGAPTHGAGAESGGAGAPTPPSRGAHAPRTNQEGSKELSKEHAAPKAPTADAVEDSASEEEGQGQDHRPRLSQRDLEERRDKIAQANFSRPYRALKFFDQRHVDDLARRVSA